jgi:hypothetical protein
MSNEIIRQRFDFVGHGVPGRVYFNGNMSRRARYFISMPNVQPVGLLGIGAYMPHRHKS